MRNRTDSFATAAEKPPSSTSLGSTSTNGGNNNNVLKGFNGSRLRQLQLERARSSISVDEETSRQDALRKWQANSNDKTTERDKILKPAATKATGFLPEERGATTQNRHQKSVAPQKVQDSGRFKNPDDPVGYVLPDLTKEELFPPKKEPLTQARQSSVDAFERHRKLKQLRKSTSENNKNNNEWNLKYPHGMPRWGPTLVTADTTRNEKKEKNKEEEEKEKESTPTLKYSSPRRRLEEDASCTTGSKSQTLSAMEKAKAQSQMAAARAVQHVVTTNSYDKDDSAALPVHVYHKEDTVVGLSSRWLGRHNGKKLAPSLLQSARMQQSRIIDSPSRTTLHQTMSLDDPLHKAAAQQKEGTHSVHSFEYLYRNFASSRDENHSSQDSDVDNDEEEVIVFENDSSDEEEEEDDEESQSWDMGTSSEGTKSGNEAASSQSSHNSNPPQQSAVPWLVLSEVDQESCSMYSDYSSLAAYMGKETENQQEQEDEFFDSAQSIKATPSGEQRTFNARRCRELLLKRNEYLQQEERRRLISPEALERLAHTPSLSKVADGDALHELVSRGRWLLSKQAHDYKVTIPAAQPPYLRPQPLATLPDNDDNDEIKPIPLVTPTAISSPVHARKVQWHRPADDEDDNKENQVLQKEESNTTTSRANRFRRLVLRCGTVLSLLSWAARIYFSLQNLFLFQSEDIGRFAVSNEDINSPSATDSICDGACSNLTFSNFLPGMTHISMRDMPIQTGLPPVAEAFNQKGNTGTSTPSSDICEATTTDFWDIPIQSEHNEFQSDEAKPWGSMFHAAMTQDQTICELGLCYLSLESPAPRHIQNVESSEKDPAVIEGFTDKTLLNALGEVLRKSSQQVQENRNISEDNSFLRVLGNAVLKSNPHLTATHVASGDGNILNLLGDKLRKSSEALQEKRQRRREVYRV